MTTGRTLGHPDPAAGWPSGDERSRRAGFSQLPGPSLPATPTALARWADILLDAMILSLAAWTVVYHISLFAGVQARWAALVELIVVPACLWAARRTAAPASRASAAAGQTNPAVPVGRERSGPRTLFGATVVTALAAAALFAVPGSPWWLTWTCWLGAAVAGTVLATGALHPGPLARPRDGGAADAARPDADGTGTSWHNGAWATFAWAIGLAGFSLWLNRPDADDSYYVNLAGWVADHGSFPLRDTVMSDLAFPATYWPPVASYDALVGTLARFSPLATLDVAYFVVPPVATFLAVLALWRLLRAWHIRAIGVALTLAMIFLLTGGNEHYSFGNHFIGRIWQGKILFIWLIIPLLLCYFQRFAQRPGRAQLGMLAAGGVAGVGFSTNAMFLVPLIAVAGVSPLLRSAPLRGGMGFLGATAYPLGAAFVTLAVGGYVGADYASMTEIIVPDWLTHRVLASGLRAAVSLLAVLVGVLVVRQREGRIIVGALALVAGVMFAPGMPAFVFDLTGLGRTLHRVVWILPVTGLIGALGAVAASHARRHVLRYGVPLTLAAALIAAGTPLWVESNGPAKLTATPQWKLVPGTGAATRQIVRHTDPQDTVLSPLALGNTIAIMDPEVKPLLPRPFYANPLKDVASFHASQRLLLKDFANGYLTRQQMASVPEALRLLDVDLICLRYRDVLPARFLEDHGYAMTLLVPGHRCYRPA